MAQVIELANSDEGIEAAVAALSRGVHLRAQMTQMERMSVAVGSTRPRYHLYLSTPGDMNHDELASRFDRLRTAIERRTDERLIYWGVFGKGAGDGGEHVHLLLWRKPQMKVWQEERKKLGLGWTKSIPVEKGMGNALKVAAYVGGQQASVFGSREHDNAVERRNERPWVMPHDRTLRTQHPELLKATEVAKDPAMTDEELFASLASLFDPLTPYQKGCVLVMVADAPALRRFKRRSSRRRARARSRRATTTPKCKAGER